MKKKLLALAVGAIIAAPVSALANAELYGRINLSIDNVDGPEGSGDSGSHELTSNKSYFGVRGGADLAGGLRGIYQLEFGLWVDEGIFGPGADIFTSRNSFLGLEGGFGTVKAGRFDTPLREIGRNVDQFNDMLAADMFNLVSGEWRADNIVQYSSPKIADLMTFSVATVAPEGDNVTGVTPNNKLFDTWSASLMFDLGDIYAGVAYDKNNYGDTGQNGLYLGAPVDAVDVIDIIRVVAGANLGALELGALIQQAENANDSDLKDLSWLLSAGFNLDERIKLKAQYGETEGDLSDEKLRQYSLGADYSLGQQTKVFVYGTRQEFESDREYAVVGIGAEHRF